MNNELRNKRKKLIWQLPFLAFLIIGTILIISRQRSTPYQHDNGFVFGTVYSITYQSENNLKKEIEAELKKVDKSLSTFNPKSTISRINSGKVPLQTACSSKSSVLPNAYPMKLMAHSISP